MGLKTAKPKKKINSDKIKEEYIQT